MAADERAPGQGRRNPFVIAAVGLFACTVIILAFFQQKERNTETVSAAEETPQTYEPHGIRVAPILIPVSSYLLFALISMAVLFWFYQTYAPATPRPSPFPAPALQPAPQADYARFLRAQDNELAGGRWVDQSTGIRTIPIDEAMKVIAARGAAAFDPLPDATEPGAPSVRPPGPAAPSDRRDNPGAGGATAAPGSAP